MGKKQKTSKNLIVYSAYHPSLASNRFGNTFIVLFSISLSRSCTHKYMIYFENFLIPENLN